MGTREQVRKTMADVLGHATNSVEDSALLTDLVNSSFLLVEMVIERIDARERQRRQLSATASIERDLLPRDPWD